MRVSNALLLAIGIAFLLQLVVPALTGQFDFDPLLAFTQPWRFITSMFLHGGFTHIFFNAYALFMFGNILETKVTKKDYLIIYFGAGILGGLFYYLTYLLGIIPPIPALGASGAIYGVLGAVAMLLPELQIFVFFFPMRMRQAVLFWIVLELIGTFDISSGVASAAHLGGLFFGLAYAWWLKKRQAPPQEYNGYIVHKYPWQEEEGRA